MKLVMKTNTLFHYITVMTQKDFYYYISKCIIIKFVVYWCIISALIVFVYGFSALTRCHQHCNLDNLLCTTGGTRLRQRVNIELW